jgi:hypothetical protein
MSLDDKKEADEMLITENTDKDELEEVAELVFGWQRFNRFYKLLS